MPNYAINMAVQEYNGNDYRDIITTGLKNKHEYCLLSMNGDLTFYLNDSIKKHIKGNEHIIGIDLYGETKGANKSHFNILLNDSLIDSSYAKSRRYVHEIFWPGNIEEIDSITIQFDNDKRGSFGDRNLSVSKVLIDKSVSIPYRNNSTYYVKTRSRKEKRINNYSTYAESAKIKLVRSGIDSSNIVAISGKNTNINRTLSSAVAVAEYFNKNEITSGNINILSIGPHSRRTWMTYKKVLGENYNIGIISLPDYRRNYTGFKRGLNSLEELSKLLYYKIILLKYQGYYN